jgi:apolipoprotein D and lipocalin family protein
MSGEHERDRGTRRRWLTSVVVMAAALAQGCSAPPPMPTARHVDLERFMGRWYVIANIPTFLERGAHNAVESYERDPDGSIATTFSFRRDAFDGELSEFRPRGFVSEESPAVWGMQFVWPFEAEYRIAYLDADYSRTIIGRTKRDYVWVMARAPQIPAAELADLMRIVQDLGYDVAQLQLVPQRW